MESKLLLLSNLEKHYFAMNQRTSRSAQKLINKNQPDDWEFRNIIKLCVEWKQLNWKLGCITLELNFEEARAEFSFKLKSHEEWPPEKQSQKGAYLCSFLTKGWRNLVNIWQVRIQIILFASQSVCRTMWKITSICQQKCTNDWDVSWDL